MSTKIQDIFKNLIGFLIISGFLATLGMMFFVEIPQGNEMAVNIVLGTLGTLTVTIVTYHFGSSKGSKDKDQTLKDLTDKLK